MRDESELAWRRPAQVSTDVKSDDPGGILGHGALRGRSIPELKKAAFIFGGEYGKGVMSCRAGEQWSAPRVHAAGEGQLGIPGRRRSRSTWCCSS